MTQQESQASFRAIQQQAKTETAELFAAVLAGRTYPDGYRVQRVRRGPNGVVIDVITGTVAGAGVFLYQDSESQEECPNIQYWVRVETPADYNSRQQCDHYGLEMGKAEDFWDGDGRWSLLTDFVESI